MTLRKRDLRLSPSVADDSQAVQDGRPEVPSALSLPPGEVPHTLSLWLQMMAIRMFIIWPMRSVAPGVYGYWAWRFYRRLKGIRTQRTPVPRCKEPLQVAMHLVGVGFYKLGRLWLSLEAIFYIFYRLKHRQLQALAPSPPRLPPGRPQEMFRRVVQAIYDIQAGGRTMGHSALGTPARLTPTPKMTPKLSPSGSALDLVRYSQPDRTESNLEELLRVWDSNERTSPELLQNEEIAQQAFGAAERAVRERLATEAEILALKHAEVSGWFLERKTGRRWPANRLCEIGQENLAEFLAWAFFHCDPHNVPAERRKEFRDLLDYGYEWAEVSFPPGHNPQVQCMRLTMDSIQSRHRPLIYYGLTSIVLPVVTERLLSARGFARHKSGSLAYWYRPGTPSSPARTGPMDGEDVLSPAPPLVFCHGIGVNVLPYIPFVSELLASTSGRDMFLVSLPHISMRIKEDVPSSSEMVACLSDMIASWGHASAHFIGHSFGSVPVAWMVRRAPDMVQMATFMDPVCFLLVKPDVCYNFIYRRASTPARLLMEFFAARELYTAHSLSRNFFWFENLLWPEQLTMPSLVVLCGQDTIVPAHSVRRYLAAYIQQHSMDSMNVEWFPDIGHGEILGPGGASMRKRVIQAMLEREQDTSGSSMGPMKKSQCSDASLALPARA